MKHEKGLHDIKGCIKKPNEQLRIFPYFPKAEVKADSQYIEILKTWA